MNYIFHQDSLLHVHQTVLGKPIVGQPANRARWWLLSSPLAVWALPSEASGPLNMTEGLQASCGGTDNPPRTVRVSFFTYVS